MAALGKIVDVIQHTRNQREVGIDVASKYFPHQLLQRMHHAAQRAMLFPDDGERRIAVET